MPTAQLGSRTRVRGFVANHCTTDEFADSVTSRSARLIHMIATRVPSRNHPPRHLNFALWSAIAPLSLYHRPFRASTPPRSLLQPYHRSRLLAPLYASSIADGRLLSQVPYSQTLSAHNKCFQIPQRLVEFSLVLFMIPGTKEGSDYH